MIRSIVFTIIAILLLSSVLLSYGDSSNVQIDLHFENGDRVSPYELYIIIYPDHMPPFRIVPDEIPAELTLDSGHRYNAELFVNDMFVEGFSIDLVTYPSQKFDLIVPTQSGLLFSIYHNDGRTVIDDAFISIESHIGTEWRDLKTAYDGKTYRTWLQSTTHETNYYIATIYLDENIFYTTEKIQLEPGTAKTLIINTSWPTHAQQFSVNVVDNDGDIIKKQKNFYVQLLNDDKILSETKVSHFGSAKFDLIPIGNYQLKLIEKLPSNDIQTWALEDVTITQEIQEFDLIREDSPIILLQSCHCIAFRLDDVQDFWLTSSQQAIMDVFEKHNSGLSLGVIGKWNGDDVDNVEFIKDKLSKNSDFKLASHGWEHEIFTSLDKNTQLEKLTNTNEKIEFIFGHTPKTFIPPQNAFNLDTANVLQQLGFTHLSSSVYWDGSPYSHERSISYFPHAATTADWNTEKQMLILNDFSQTFSNAMDFYNQNGYAVVMLHPQEFSVMKNNAYTSELNLDAINELDKLIERFENEGLDIVSIDSIPRYIVKSDGLN